MVKLHCKPLMLNTLFQKANLKIFYYLKCNNFCTKSLTKTNTVFNNIFNILNYLYFL